MMKSVIYLFLTCSWFVEFASAISEMHDMAIIDNLEYVKPGRKLMYNATILARNYDFCSL
jgi:hypothetical protein